MEEDQIHTPEENQIHTEEVTVTPEPVAAEVITPEVITPEDTYSPPEPSKEQAAVVTDAAHGGVFLNIVIDGRRYAVTAANEADARQLLTDSPEMCRVP
jgi:hypothetical protein